jgi:hypothetical protein
VGRVGFTGASAGRAVPEVCHPQGARPAASAPPGTWGKGARPGRRAGGGEGAGTKAAGPALGSAGTATNSGGSAATWPRVGVARSPRAWSAR